MCYWTKLLGFGRDTVPPAEVFLPGSSLPLSLVWTKLCGGSVYIFGWQVVLSMAEVQLCSPRFFVAPLSLRTFHGIRQLFEDRFRSLLVPSTTFIAEAVNLITAEVIQWLKRHGQCVP